MKMHDFVSSAPLYDIIGVCACEHLVTGKYGTTIMAVIAACDEGCWVIYAF